jgi:hypothetical protein
LVRVRSATSAILLASPAIDRSPAFWMTGVSRPLLGVDRDREVLVIEVGDLALLGVDRGVE